MPRFYFHLHNDQDVPDAEGLELPDLPAATAYAGDQARQWAGETLKERGRIVLSHRIDIENRQGAVLQTVRLGDVLTIED